jgi:hypothetical protein
VSDLVKPGSGVLFMKVGTHAKESIESIIERKRKEIDDAGFALWGFGGGTCHPTTMVQPFASAFEKRGRVIYLVMEEMESHHFAEQKRAEQWSADGLSWLDIPKPVNVLGSRYALRIKSLRRESFDLQLASTRVAVGPSVGRPGHLYVSGRVDKACLEVIDEPVGGSTQAKIAKISLVAEVEAPYAVLLRDRP